MKRKLNCILLIDDDEPTNYLHKMVIEEADCTEQVIAVESGQEALDYLHSKPNGKHPRPELIFLDINMPAMNGWEFLQHYKGLDIAKKGDVIVVMLTTSLHPADLEKADKIGDINGFRNKPLTVEMLWEIIEEYFGG